MSRKPLNTKLSNFSFEELVGKAIREGSYAGIECIQTNLTVNPTGTVKSAITDQVPTEHFVALSATLAANKPVCLQFQQISGPQNSSFSRRFFVGDNESGLIGSQVQVRLDELWYAGQNTSLQATEGTGTGYKITAGISGYRITADLNFNADKVIMWIGDSITRGSSMGGTAMTTGQPAATVVTPEDHFAFQARNAFQRRGIDCRLVLKAMGGFTSRNMGVWLKQGWLDIEQADVIFYQLGVNDASGTTSDGEFQAELDRIVDLRDRKFPNAKVVFVGDTPLNNNTNETRLGQLRALKAAMADADERLYYMNLGSAFDRTVLSNYTSSDGVHPNVASNALIGDAIESWIIANDFEF